MNTPIDLEPSHKQLIMELLRQYLPQVTVWAYGSRVKLSARPSSDLDLVAFAQPEQAGQIAELTTAFEESNLPFRVDLFVWNEVPSQFRQNIQHEHYVLQQGKLTQSLDPVP